MYSLNAHALDFATSAMWNNGWKITLKVKTFHKVLLPFVDIFQLSTRIRKRKRFHSFTELILVKYTLQIIKRVLCSATRIECENNVKWWWIYINACFFLHLDLIFWMRHFNKICMMMGILLFLFHFLHDNVSRQPISFAFAFEFCVTTFFMLFAWRCQLRMGKGFFFKMVLFRQQWINKIWWRDLYAKFRYYVMNNYLDKLDKIEG